MTNTHFICLLAALISTVAAAQTPTSRASRPRAGILDGARRDDPNAALGNRAGPKQAPTQQDPARLEVVTTTYSVNRSWALFAACDEDSDDRIDILEATRTIGAMSIEDRSTYRSIDTDTDGYLQWSEFNAHFFAAIQAGDQFRLRLRGEPLAPFDPTLPPTAPSLQVSLIRTKDRNRDEILSDVEFREFLLDANMTARPTFTDVDVDESGAVDEVEMQAILPLLLNGGRRLLREFKNNPNTLPPKYERADTDHSGTLDQDELGISLFAIDPALLRWSSVILANADLSSNGLLDRTELERAE